MTYYWDMDGVLANFHKAYATDKAVALKRNAMANLEPFAENVETLRSLIAAGHTCYILTKAANADGAQGKIEWLAKYIPEMDEAHIIIITKGRKVDNIREDGILVRRGSVFWRRAGLCPPDLLLIGSVYYHPRPEPCPQAAQKGQRGCGAQPPENPPLLFLPALVLFFQFPVVL